jgi:hypothetical protein
MLELSQVLTQSYGSLTGQDADPGQAVLPSWLKLVRTLAAAVDSFEDLAEVVRRGRKPRHERWLLIETPVRVSLDRQ